MSFQYKLIAALTLILILLVACNNAEPAVTPTSQVVYITATPRVVEITTTPLIVDATATLEPTALPPSPTSEPRIGTVLLIFGDRFILEIYETVRPALEDAGYEVLVASRTMEAIRAKNADLKVEVDLLLEDVQVSKYDAILFNCDNDITFGSALVETDRIAQEAVDQGIVLGAICSGPRILAYAQVVDGKTVTGEPSQTCQMLKDEGGTCTGKNVERDGLLITARDRYASRAFAATIIEALQEESSEITPEDNSNSETIAFTSEQDGNMEIYTMNADGSDIQRLTDHPREDYWPTWSPDGAQIAFASQRDGDFEIYAMNSDGTDLRRLTHETGDDLEPAWSPDGEKIAFMVYRDNKSDVYIMNADGSERQQLTDSQGDNYLPKWSPDGTQIVFVSERDGNPEICTMRADGGDQQRLTDNLSDDLYPSWSPDGVQIAFYSERDGRRELYVMNVDGSDPRPLTHDDANIWVSDWSPDGSRIAFTSNRDGNREIYILELASGSLERLTDTPSLDGIPTWRPQTANESMPPDSIFVPSGNSPTLDGTLSPGEWNDATIETFADGSELLLMQHDDYLYIGIRVSEPEMVSVNVHIQQDDEVSILHSSAALGTAIYQKGDENWVQIQNFTWHCRGTGNSESAQAERAEFLDEEGWLASNGRMGTPNEVEYKIIPPEKDFRLAVVFIRSSPPYEKVPFPANLDDDCIMPTPGGLPLEMQFSPGKWGGSP